MRTSPPKDTREAVDRFYIDHGPCCAGCDYWRYYNAVVGEYIKSAPVSGAERYAGIGMGNISMTLPAGHVLTRREHVCGSFSDQQEPMAKEPACTKLAKSGNFGAKYQRLGRVW